jgi:hypothetical protein
MGSVITALDRVVGAAVGVTRGVTEMGREGPIPSALKATTTKLMAVPFVSPVAVMGDA